MALRLIFGGGVSEGRSTDYAMGTMVFSFGAPRERPSWAIEGIDASDVLNQ
jgi:hypothetical protein